MLKGEVPTIYGDGEQLRDYVYVGDVVRANLLAIKKLLEGVDLSTVSSIDTLAYNVGTGQGTSVNELFRLLKEATDYKGEAVYGQSVRKGRTCTAVEDYTWRSGRMSSSVYSLGQAYLRYSFPSRRSSS